MLTSLALVFLLGLAAAALCSRIGLPRIIGMLLTGILIGPYVLNWLDDSSLSISSVPPKAVDLRAFLPMVFPFYI